MTLENTIIWGVCNGPEESFVTNNGNLEWGDTCYLGNQDVPNASAPGLAPIAHNGGPTMTYRPLPGSLVVDHQFAQANCASTDQRYVVRPVDGDADDDPVCDIGAVEWVPDELFIDGFEGGYPSGWSAVTD